MVLVVQLLLLVFLLLLRFMVSFPVLLLFMLVVALPSFSLLFIVLTFGVTGARVCVVVVAVCCVVCFVDTCVVRVCVWWYERVRLCCSCCLVLLSRYDRSLFGVYVAGRCDVSWLFGLCRCH